MRQASAFQSHTSPEQASDPVEEHASPTYWYVYLLECADGTYYCGITTNPERRLAQHNGLRPGGARYTRSRRPVRLRACRVCADRSQAGRLERHVQSLPRGKKIAFFSEKFPC